MTFTSAHLYGNVYIPVGVARALSDLSDLGLLGEQSSQTYDISLFGSQRIKALDADKLPRKI